MWSGSDGPYEGQHYRLGRTLNVPQALSAPHPPILIGGSGEKKTLRLVARYANACNLWPTPEIPHKLAVLREHCAAVGRDYAEIEKTSIFTVDPGEQGENLDELIGRLRWLAGMGIETVIISVKDVWRLDPLKIIGDRLIPAVADLQPAAV